MGIETRNLGTSGVAVTALGFGGATLGGVGDRVSETEADDVCLLYTSAAAEDTPCVDLGGRRII